MIDKVEALLEAIGKLNGMHNPESECFRLRNPLMIRSFARPGKHVISDAGVRVFPSILAGLKAGLFDLDLKIRGQSRAGLRTTDKVTNLLGCYGVHNKAAIDNVVSFLRRALEDQSISANTELSYFLSKEEEGSVINA